MKIFLQVFYYQTMLLITGLFLFPELTIAAKTQYGPSLFEASLPAFLGIICVVLLLLLSSVFLLYSQHKKLNNQLIDNKNKDTHLNTHAQTNTRDELNRAHEKYNELINTILDGCVEFTLNGVIININNAVANIFNCRRNDLIGQHYTRLLSVTNNREIENVYKNIFKTGQSAQIKNVGVTGRDNIKRIVEVSASLMHGSNGEPVGFRGIFRDVTELTKAEINQNILREQLQRSQQIEAIGALAGGIAHDFNNLLMAIQGNTSILLFNMEKENLLYNKLINIEACVTSGAELTKQLLGFAKERKSNPGIININDLVKEIAGTFKRTKKEIQLHEKFAPDIWNIEADTGQIKQVILSLFINSWQMVPANKFLSIDTTNISLSSESAGRLGVNAGKYVQVTISNFEGNIPNTRNIDTISEIKTGINAGIGITSSSEVIKSYNGLIEFKKFSTDKTSYILYFPVFEGKITKAIEPVVVQENGTGTVLFVDDEEMIIEVGKPMLEELGYDVLVARGGEEAIKVYEVHKGEIDLVILDMVMPKINGGDVYNVLKKINPEVKTLLSSGYSLNEQADRLLENGCNGFIQKPFNLKRLSLHIKEALEPVV